METNNRTNTLLRPRWLLIAALLAFGAGIVGLLLGEPRWSPMALFASELLVILAAITKTTPSIPESLAAQAAGREAASNETERSEASLDADTPAEPVRNDDPA